MTPQQWASMLRMAVKTKGISWAELARETPISSSCLMKMKRGERIISLEVAERLAHALDMPALSLGVIEMRTKTCVVCNGTFVDRGKNHYARTCSDACLSTRRMREARQVTHERLGRQHLVMKRRIEKYTLSVLAFCRACEPEGMCRTPKCELRTVSPLPLKKGLEK